MGVSVPNPNCRLCGHEPTKAEKMDFLTKRVDGHIVWVAVCKECIRKHLENGGLRHDN